jgi:hypothetical protein
MECSAEASKTWDVMEEHRYKKNTPRLEYVSSGNRGFSTP